MAFHFVVVWLRHETSRRTDNTTQKNQRKRIMRKRSREYLCWKYLFRFLSVMATLEVPEKVRRRFIHVAVLLSMLDSVREVCTRRLDEDPAKTESRDSVGHQCRHIQINGGARAHFGGTYSIGQSLAAKINTED